MPFIAPSVDRPSPPRTLGRFTLREVLGKSERTMVWRVTEADSGAECMLFLPRQQPVDPQATEAWDAGARAAARLRHPRLARVRETGVANGWPYVCIEREVGVTLREWLRGRSAPTPAESAGGLAQALEALAYLHDAGLVHGDPQLHTVLVDPAGRLLLAGAQVAPAAAPAVAPPVGSAAAGHTGRTLQREAARRDVLAFGALLHQLLAGRPAFDIADTGVVIERLPPLGREAVRLPWETPHRVPEALRAIADRALASNERLRYLGARTLLRALDGWRVAHAEETGGALGLLIDRLYTVGHLPGMRGVLARVGRLVGRADAQHTHEIAEQIIDDTGLALELLRIANSPQVQATQAPGNGAVLTIRRAITLIGIDGVRRAANSLRVWPGPLDASGARALEEALAGARWAARTAQALRPPGYDAEVVYLVTMLQSLGRLLVRYHFPDEADQIAQLMQPEAGLSEATASQAVLGTDIESIGAAVARHWALGDAIQHVIRRFPLGAPVRRPASDDDVLRLTASAAIEAVDAAGDATPERAAAGLDRVARRYARPLKIDLRGLRECLDAARHAGRTAGRSLDAEAPADDTLPASDAAQAA